VGNLSGTVTTDGRPSSPERNVKDFKKRRQDITPRCGRTSLKANYDPVEGVCFSEEANSGAPSCRIQSAYLAFSGKSFE
jgi:hypothetical protein